MDDRWYPYVKFAVPFETFLELPQHPAYKWEYWDGHAHLSPRPKLAQAVLALDGRPDPPAPEGPLGEEIFVRPWAEDDWHALPELFAVAFHRVPPFSQLEDDRAVEAAADCLERTRTGADGPLLPTACLVAEAGGQAVGGLLVTLLADADPQGLRRWRPAPQDAAADAVRPHLTWTFVAPLHARHGIGALLLGQAVAALRDLGHRELGSTFLVGNASSMLWHWREGFRLLPLFDSPREMDRRFRHRDPPAEGE